MLKAQNTVDCGKKFGVIGYDSEMRYTFDSKLCNILDFCFLLIWVFVYTNCVSPNIMES